VGSPRYRRNRWTLPGADHPGSAFCAAASQDLLDSRRRKCVTRESCCFLLRRCYGLAGSLRGRPDPTAFAAEGSVGLEPGRTRLPAGRVELIGDPVAATEKHLVGRLSAEGRVWNHGIVLADVPSDELLDGREAVHPVDEQPVVLERSLPSLDQAIRVRHLDLSEETSQGAQTEQLIDLGVDVLHARVRHHGGGAGRIEHPTELLGSLGQHQTGGQGFESGHELPGQDTPREVVDHGVQVGLGSVQELDDGDVDVQDLPGVLATIRIRPRIDQFPAKDKTCSFSRLG